MLIQGIDAVERRIARADAQPGTVLHHLDGRHPDVDAEVVGTIPPSRQQAGDARADRIDLGGRHHKASGSNQQHGQRHKTSPERRPVACPAQQQQQQQHGTGSNHSQPAAAAVGEQRGCCCQHQCGSGKQLGSHPTPAHQCDRCEGNQRQQVTRQEVGVSQGAIDPNGAGTDGIRIGPARQCLAGGIQLSQSQNTAEQAATQQSGDQPVPPSAVAQQQLAEQGINAQVAEQFDQAFAGGDWNWRTPRGHNRDGQKKHQPARDGSDALRWRTAEAPEQPKNAAGCNHQGQACACEERKTREQGQQQESRQPFKAFQHRLIRSDHPLPAHQQGPTACRLGCIRRGHRGASGGECFRRIIDLLPALFQI